MKKSPQKLPKNDYSPGRKVDSFSREMLKRTVSSEKESFLFNQDKNLRLRILADVNDHLILKDEFGNYYLDRSCSYSTGSFSENDFSEYEVQRQRMKVTAGFAIESLMRASIPNELLSLLPPAWVNTLNLV